MSIVTTLPGGVKVKTPNPGRSILKKGRRRSDSRTSRTSGSRRRSDSRGSNRGSSKGRNKPGRRGGKPQQPNVGRNRAAIERSVKTPTVSQHTKYLYGFLDPTANKTRGPNRCPYPTVCFQMSAATDITLQGGANINQKTGLNYRSVLDKGGHNVPPQDASGFEPIFNGTPDSQPFTNVYYTETQGDPVTFVACPHATRTVGGSLTVNHQNEPLWATTQFDGFITSGFICSSKDTFGKPMYTNTAYTLDNLVPTSSVHEWTGTYDCPLKQFNRPLSENPFLTVEGRPNDDFFRESQPHAPVQIWNTVPWRTTGLSIGVQNTSTPLTARGTAVGGDNRMLFGQSSQSYYEWQNTQILTDVGGGGGVQLELADLATAGTTVPSTYEQAFNGPTMSQSRRDLGAFPAGTYLNSSYIPSSDRILQFRSDTSSMSTWNQPLPEDGALNNNNISYYENIDPSPAQPYVMTRGELLMNNPAAYITVSGWQDGATYRITVTWNIEVALSTSGPLAMFMEAARFAQNYVVNWSALQDVMCAGINGDNLAAAAGNPVVVGGALAAIAAATVPAPVPPNSQNYQNAVRSFTHRVTSQLPPRVTKPTVEGMINHAEHGETNVPNAIVDAAVGGTLVYQNRSLLSRLAKTVGSGFSKATAWATREAATVGRGILTRLPAALEEGAMLAL